MGGLGLRVAGFPAETALKVLRGLLVGRPVVELVLDVVVHHQRPGTVEQDLVRHPAELPERALKPFEPARLALVPERAHVQTTRVAERSDEQVDP
jgi:hypothetical protein